MANKPSPRKAMTADSSSTPVQKFSTADEGTPTPEAAEAAEEAPKSTGVAPSVGNGGRGPNYTWTQTLKDLVIMVPVPLGRRT